MKSSEKNDRFRFNGELMLFSLALLSLMGCSFLKSSWKLSEGMKEFHSKHFTMLTCLHAYLFFHGTRFYQANDTDIFIVTFGRSGTMMTVNLLHQLRTGGHDKFDDITRVGHHFVPITGLGHEYLNEPQFGEPPRLFFTHGFPWQVPKANHYIYVIRNPVDIAKSWYTFGKQFYQLRSQLTFDEFFYNCLMKDCFWPRNPLWNHIVAWFNQRDQDNSNILWLHFEKFAKDQSASRKTIQKVGKFLGKHISYELETKIYHRISYRYFLNNQRKFNIHDIQEAAAYVINECMNRDDFTLRYDKIGVESVTKKRVQINVSQPILDVMQRRWTEIVYPVTGYEDYKAMLKDVTDY